MIKKDPIPKVNQKGPGLLLRSKKLIKNAGLFRTPMFWDLKLKLR